jgi:hypothetical protein
MLSWNCLINSSFLLALVKICVARKGAVAARKDAVVSRMGTVVARKRRLWYCS